MEKKFKEVGGFVDIYDEFFLGRYEGTDNFDKFVRFIIVAGISLDRLVKDIKEKVRVVKDFWV